ncbi:MAG: helix-turn-helix transcriptional regulator [Alistipes indistinctus]
MAIVMQMKRINRLKVILAEQGKTGKWLAQALGKNESTVSRWCTNEVQPSIETLLAIAEVLKIDVKELLCSTQTDK